MKTTLALILATLGLSASLASAHGKPHPVPADILAKYDLDKNGKLNAAELAKWRADIKAAEAARRAAFIAKYDKNGDGVLDVVERAAANAAIKAEQAAVVLAAQIAKFKALDTDGVAGLSDKEWAASYPAGSAAARITAAFTAKDTDKNGTISQPEYIASPVRHGHGVFKK